MTLGAIEAGGTKWICAVGTGPLDVVAETRIDTTTPAETLASVIDFFRDHDVEAIGIASFGPIELRRDHPQYGYITTTPKPGWAHTDVVGPLHTALGVPVGIDTDVNGAAVGEGRWGAARSLDTFAYLTVGTGIGGGAVVNGQIVHGLVHAEMGHVAVRRHPDDAFEGACPFHGDCFEGMASGPALEARWGSRPDELVARQDVLDMEAFYIAEGLRTIVYLLAPERIIVGGGVAKLDGLFPAIRSALSATLAGYPGLPEHQSDDFVVPPGLADRSGIAGAFALAELARSPRRTSTTS